MNSLRLSRPKLVDLADAKDNKILGSKEDLLGCFDEIFLKENFLESSEAILKYVSSIASSEDKVCVADEVKYAIKKLVCGLESSKQCSRHGSYTTLQALLQLHRELLPFTADLIDTYFKEEMGSDKKHIDKAMGITLAFGAIIRSGCATDDPFMLKKIIHCLALENSATYIEPVAGQFLVNLLIMYKEDNVGRLMWQELSEHLQKDLKKLPLRLLWLRIVIARDEYLEGLKGIKTNFQAATFSEDYFIYIASVFKENFAQGVNITPMIENFLQSLLLYRNGCVEAGNLTLFLASAMNTNSDNSAKTLSSEDVIFDFNIAQMALPHLMTRDHIEAVLSPSLMEQLVSYNAWGDESVCASARGLMSAILQAIVANKSKDNDVQLGIMNRLTSTSVKLGFDVVTKTTLLQQANAHLSASTIQGLSDILSNSFKGFRGAKDSRDVEVWQYLSRLICHSSLAGSEHVLWRAVQVEKILKFTFFRKMPKELRAKLNKIFLKAFKQPTYITIPIEDQVTFVDYIVAETCSYLRNYHESCTLDSESQDCFEASSQRMQEMKEETDLPSSLRVAFRLLLGHMILHLFVDKKGSMELITKFDECFEKAKLAGSCSSTSTAGEEWVEELLHLLLFILSKGENVWRKVVITVFKNMCHTLHPNFISLLTDVICPKYKKNKLEEEDYESEENEDEQFENEYEGGETDDSDEGEDDNESESTDDESDEDEDAERKVKMFKLKLEMQKVAGIEADCIDLDSVPEEELENFDKKMGEFFTQLRSLRNAKKREEKEAKKYKTSQVHFFCRVCDLIEVLINEAPSLAHFLPLLQPLLLALDKTVRNEGEEAQFASKIKSIFDDLVKIKKFKKTGTFTVDDVAAELQSLMIFSQKLSKRVNKQIGMCCLYLIQSGLRLSEDDDKDKQADRLYAVYTQHLKIMFAKDSEAISAPLCLEYGSIALVLDKLVDMTFTASVRRFKKKQGLAAIKMIFLNQKARVKMRQNLLKDIHTKLSKGIIQTFDSVSDVEDFPTRLFIDLVDLLRTLKRIHVSNPDLASSFSWPDIGSSLVSFSERIPLTDFKNLKKPLTILAKLIGVDLKSCQVNPDGTGNPSENQSKKTEKKTTKTGKNRVNAEMEEERCEVEQEDRKTKKLRTGTSTDKRKKTQKKIDTKIDASADKQKKTPKKIDASADKQIKTDATAGKQSIAKKTEVSTDKQEMESNPGVENRAEMKKLEKERKKERKEKRKLAKKEAKERKKAKMSSNEDNKKKGVTMHIKRKKDKFKKQTKMRRMNKLLDVPELKEFSFTANVALESIDDD